MFSNHFSYLLLITAVTALGTNCIVLVVYCNTNFRSLDLENMRHASILGILAFFLHRFYALFKSGLFCKLKEIMKILTFLHFLQIDPFKRYFYFPNHSVHLVFFSGLWSRKKKVIYCLLVIIFKGTILFCISK